MTIEVTETELWVLLSALRRAHDWSDVADDGVPDLGRPGYAKERRLLRRYRRLEKRISGLLQAREKTEAA